MPALLGGHAHCQTSGFKSSSSGLELFANIAEQQILAAGPSGWSLCPLADQGQDWGMCCPGTGTIWAMISSCWYLPRLRSTAICGPCWLQEHESMLMGSGGLVGGRVGPLPQAWAWEMLSSTAPGVLKASRRLPSTAGTASDPARMPTSVTSVTISCLLSLVCL